jgi:precorrin-6B methylase 1
MKNTKINILRKGDSVISATETTIAVQRKNGEVDVIPIISENGNLRVDVENIITISYGKNTVETSAKGETGDVQIVTF